MMMSELIEYFILGIKIWSSLILFVVSGALMFAPLDGDEGRWFIIVTWPIGFLITGWLCTMWFL